MEIKDLFGLPAHPLVVHAAVVLLPLAAIAIIVLAALPRHRHHYALVVLGAALVATVAVGLAQQSGEALEERVDESEAVEEHTEKGETVLPWAIAVTVVAAGIAAAGPVRSRYPNVSAKQVTAVLVVASVIAGAGAIYTVAEVGHSGAKATWNDLPAEGGEGGESGESGESG
jgi:hypothetical protein